MASFTQDMEDQKALVLLEAVEARYVEMLTAERGKDMEDQRAIAFLEAEEAHYVGMLSTKCGGASERPGETASSVAKRQPDEQVPMISTKTSDDRPFPFMKLPLELRTKVYKAHLVLPGTIAISGGIYWNRIALRSEGDVHEPLHRNGESIDPTLYNLWAVSKTVYHESVPVFFRYNSFHYDDLTRLSGFLICIGPTARRYLTSVSVHYAGTGPAKAMKLLKGCVGLRNLTIEISGGSWGFLPCSAQDPRLDMMRMYGLSDLLKVRGIKKLVVIASSSLRYYRGGFFETMPLLEEALEVLKQPHRPDQLKRQERKDYPQKATRTVFGKTNVKTRAEKKLMAAFTDGHSQIS